MRDIRIAAVIYHSPLGEVQKNLDRMSFWVKRAARQGASIICFPEMNITGYNVKQAMQAVAITDIAQITDALTVLAQQYQIMILAGLAEKDTSGRIFATHLAVGPDPSQSGVYRKLHLAAPEKALYAAGSEMPLFTFKGVTFGIQLCFDAHFPELSSQMAIRGAEVLFLPHASPRGTPESKYQSWMRHLPARAYDNSLFVIACNQTGENHNGLFFPGVAIGIGPSGEVLAKELASEEALMVVDLKADDFNRVRDHRMRYFLPHRRPELYKA